MYPDKQSAVDASRSARDLLQLISLPLRDVKPVSANLMASLARLHGASRLFFWWLSSTAGYVPGNEARISSSDMALHKRVLSCGCYPFLSGRSEFLSVFLASLSASTKSVIASANRSAFTLSQSLTTPFADPLAGLKSRNLGDTDAYTENNFWGQTFVCFIFSPRKHFCEHGGVPVKLSNQVGVQYMKSSESFCQLENRRRVQ